MGILSGMLIAACIGFFTKKKLPQKAADDGNKQKDDLTSLPSSSIPTNNQAAESDTQRIINPIEAWDTKMKQKK